jgi:hypothetical protein
MHNESTSSDLTQKPTAQDAKHALPTSGATSTARVSHADEEMIISFCRKSRLQVHRIASLRSQFITLFDSAEIEHFGANALKMPPILRHYCRSRTLSSRLYLRKVKRRKNARRSTPGMLDGGPVDRFLHPFFFLSVVTGCGHLEENNSATLRIASKHQMKPSG